MAFCAVADECTIRNQVVAPGTIWRQRKVGLVAFSPVVFSPPNRSPSDCARERPAGWHRRRRRRTEHGESRPLVRWCPQVRLPMMRVLVMVMLATS